MNLAGRRVHITGSATAVCDADLLGQAHQFIAVLAAGLLDVGAGLVLGAGGEPLSDTGPPSIFDWTALEVIANAPDPAPGWPSRRADRFVAVGSQRGLDKIPANRREIWDRCCQRADFDLAVAPPGWRMAGIIRERQVGHGDILLALGGGAGVEHLAELYWRDGKPVIAVRAELGAANHDGVGGSRALHNRALNEPKDFFTLASGKGGATARLQELRLETGMDPDALAKATVRMLEDLLPPRAFYVRLLDDADPAHADVEWFFSKVITPAIHERGYAPVQLGLGEPHSMFMNVEIFEQLHRAGVVIVDLTGMRPNCTMELGYALARPRRTLISAQKGTSLIFDTDKLPTHFWQRADADEACTAYLDWFDRYVDVGPLVT